MSVEENAAIFLSAIRAFNDRGVRYLVLRDVNNKLPNNICEGDVDLLVHPDSSAVFGEILTEMNFCIYPCPSIGGYLYGMRPALMYVRAGVCFHVFYELAVVSLENGSPWVPLNPSLQRSAWNHRTPYNEWYILGPEDQMVNLILRGVFDKNGLFSDAYLRELHFLRSKVDLAKVGLLLGDVFFKFTPCIMEMIGNEEYNAMRSAYIAFEGY